VGRPIGVLFLVLLTAGVSTHAGCRKYKGISGFDVDAALEAGVPDAAILDAAADAAVLDAALEAGVDAAQDAAITDGAADDGGVDDGGADGTAGDGGVITCPADMVVVENQFCMDIYEASRPDATDTFDGTDTSYATSRFNVRPWMDPTMTLSDAQTACQNAGKRLCTVSEWVTTCQGPQVTVYSYGDTYDATTCNGIDAFCDCGSAACQAITPCPFPHCFSQCGAPFHVVPTGTFTNCVSGYGTYDMNGNLWEIADSTDMQTHVMGGAANCFNSELLHVCNGSFVISGGFPPFRGFRCCLTP
jgi:hypothetical protein